MGLFLDQYEEIAWYSAVLGFVTFAADCQLHSVFHSCRNLDFDLDFAGYKAGAAAGTAWVLDYLTCAAAVGACSIGDCLAEEAVDYALFLTCAVAVRAGLDVGSVLRAFSATVRTCLVPVDFDFLLHAGSDFLESEEDLLADVAAAVCPLLGTSLAAESESAESSSEASESASKEVVQDVVEVAESAAEVEACLAVYSGVAELVVFGPFVFVAEHGICLGGLLEFLLGGLLLGVCAVYPFVRMPLQGELPVGGFYLVFGSALLDSQYLVIISFLCHN